MKGIQMATLVTKVGRRSLVSILVFVGTLAVAGSPAIADASASDRAPSDRVKAAEAVVDLMSDEIPPGNGSTDARCEIDCGGGGNPPPPCYPTIEYCDNFWIVCTPSISHSVSPEADPESGLVYSRIRWSANFACRSSYYAAHAEIAARTVLRNRTEGRDNEVLGSGQSVSGRDNVTSSGEVVFYEADYGGAASDAEVVFEATFRMTGVHPSNVWKVCDPIGGLRYVEPCRGLGTQTMYVPVGSHQFATGLVAGTPGCTDDHHTHVISSRIPGTSITVTWGKMTSHIKWCWDRNNNVTKIERITNTDLEPLERNVLPSFSSGQDGTPYRTQNSYGRWHGRFSVTAIFAYKHTIGQITYEGSCSGTIDGTFIAFMNEGGKSVYNDRTTCYV